MDNDFSFPAHCYRSFLRRGTPSVSRRAKEGLRVRGLPDDPGKVHQHVCRVGRAEEHEVQRQERPLGLQTVRVTQKQNGIKKLYRSL